LRFALHVPNLADPGELVEMGVIAEESGWDGFLLWDHVFAGPAFPVPMVDPWVVLGGLAVETSRIRLGTAVTPLARRRPQKVAREAVTVDHLSRGRMVLGVGLGNPPQDEYGAFGEPSGGRLLAARLNEALDVIAGLWTGQPFDYDGEHFTVDEAQFLPTPVQQPRIPVWVACQIPHRAPLRRAARWDGVILAAMTEPGRVETIGTEELGSALQELDRLRGGLEHFDVAVLSHGLPKGKIMRMYEASGVRWVLVTGWIHELRNLAASPPC
jgi:alkanesulfonate monooxygenase SsuD/methylene tetrahydromethanopterin reductase-like flavin-dependent oxidoreductase (luciferase family)